MIRFACDRDILKYEPILFGELYFPDQVILSGTAAELTGSRLSKNGTDWNVNGISAGNVVYVSTADGQTGCFEITTVAPQSLTISVLRDDSAGSGVAPGISGDVDFRISTFNPQIAEASFALCQYFGLKPGDPASPYGAEMIADTGPLRQACTFAVLSSIFAIMADSGDNTEASWKKIAYYQKLFERSRERAHAAIDGDADGIIDRTFPGSSFVLKRD